MINQRGAAVPRTITSFRGAFNWLSNFYQTPVVLDQIVYPSAEHAFHAEKTNDMTMRRMIAAAATSSEAKRLGRAVTLVDGWNEWRRYDAMARIQAAKFSPRSQLAGWLLGTGSSVLIEGNNWHDNTWGVCYCGKCSNGHNLLGWIIMMQRRYLGGK
jgi:ribA/ribD-fused uncharacterized protein